jgi:ferredoxin
MARVQSYGDVIDRYRTHPEAKSLGPNGMPCGRRAVGLLQHRPVALGELVHIGKETNRLEEVEQGLVHDWDQVQLVFQDPQCQIHEPNTQPKPREIEQRRCVTCGVPIRAARKMYCSSACRQRAYRNRQRHAMT